MNIPTVEYLSWHKARTPVAYDLAISNVPQAPLAPLMHDPAEIDAEVARAGGYGHPGWIEHLARQYRVSESSVLPMTGTSLCNFAAIACVVERGDRVLVETPGYEPIARAVEWCGGQVELLDRRLTRDGSPPPLAVGTIEQAARTGVSVVVLTNHQNPTGVRLSRDQMAPIAAACERAGVWLIIDEVYLDAAHVCNGEAWWTAAGMNDRVIVTNSLTKVYGLSALRAGWLIAAPAIVQKARALVDTLYVIDSKPAQVLAWRAAKRIGEFAERTRTLTRERRGIVNDWLAARPDVTANRDDGLYFVWLRVQGVDDTATLADVLLETYDTRATPGRLFGDPSGLRVGFGDASLDLAEALRRVGSAIDRLRK